MEAGTTLGQAAAESEYIRIGLPTVPAANGSKSRSVSNAIHVGDELDISDHNDRTGIVRTIWRSLEVTLTGAGVSFSSGFADCKMSGRN